MKYNKIYKNPLLAVVFLFQIKIIRTLVSDAVFYKIVYFLRTWSFLNLKKPTTFNEKINYLKLNDRRPELTDLVDKHSVKEIIRKKIKDNILIPTLGVYEKYNDIDFNDLPESFVIKCTHDSGSVWVIENKSEINHDLLSKTIKSNLNKNYFWLSREWPYKNVIPKILIEKKIGSKKSLLDYKFYCFNGLVKFIHVDIDRYTNHSRNIYDVSWNYLNMSIEYPTNSSRKINKPKNLKHMIDIASSLSVNHKFVRVDLFNVEDKIYFGELTFHHGAGYEKFTPERYNTIFGDSINL